MIAQKLIQLGFTRDDATWLWSRVVAGSALLASGLVDLTKWGFTPGWVRAITIVSVVVMWLAGKYDASPLPKDPEKH